MQIGSNLINLASSLSQGFLGLMNSGKKHQQASEQLMQQFNLASQADLASQNSFGFHPHPGESGVVVNIRRYPTTGLDNIASDQMQSSDFESSVVSLFEAGVTYSANAKIIKAQKSRWDSLFDERA